MKITKLALIALLSLGAFSIKAEELSPDAQAKLLRVIVTASNAAGISCKDTVLKAALAAEGIPVDANAPILWATSSGEAKMGKMTGRLVITGQRDLLPYAAILLEEKEGRPKIVINSTNLRASRLQVGDAILKVAEKI